MKSALLSIVSVVSSGTTWEWLAKILLGALTWALATFFGGWTASMTALGALILADVITGYLRAVGQREVSSKIATTGNWKKVFIILAVAIAWIAGNELGVGIVVRNAVVSLFIASESVSILENLSGMGIGIPKVLTDVLAQLNEKATASASIGLTDDSDSLDNSADDEITHTE